MAVQNKSGNRGCFQLIIWFGGLALLGLIWELVTTFVLGSKEDINRFLDPDESNISTLKFLFWTVIVSIILYFVLGGSVEDIFKGDSDSDAKK